MTREEVLDAVYDEVTANDTCVEDAVVSLLDEIVRMRATLDALREPSEAMVKAVDAALVHAPTRADVFRELIRRAVEAAEQEVNP